MTPPTLIIDDQPFSLVCGDSTTGRAVYRGPKSYLRIGGAAYIKREVAVHRLLLAQRFPVAPLLAVGEYAGQAFFIEAAVGEVVFGDLFESEVHAQGAVSDASFSALLTLVLQWTKAQLQNIAHATYAELERTVCLDAVARLLPEFATLTHQAFALAQQRLVVFPTVFTHGDFHAYNICAGGVIDLEMVHWSVAGYDVITGLFGDDLFPPELRDFTYTAHQLEIAHVAIDQLFQTYGLPAPSTYAADFRLCRMMRIVELAEKRPLAVQQWIYQRYMKLAKIYVGRKE